MGKDAGLEIVRDLIAQIVLDLVLNPIFIKRIDDMGLDRVIAQKRFVALIELPEGLVRPLPVDPKLRGQF